MVTPSTGPRATGPPRPPADSVPAGELPYTEARRFSRYLTAFLVAAPPLLAWLVYRRPDTLTLGQGFLAAAVVLLGFAPALAFLSAGTIVLLYIILVLIFPEGKLLPPEAPSEAAADQVSAGDHR